MMDRQEEQTIDDLRRQFAEIRFGFFLGATLLMVVLMIWNLFTALNIERMARHFEDLIGSRDKLPYLTIWVLDYGRMASGYLPFAFVFSFTIATIAVMNVTRRSCKFVWIAAIAVAVLVAHWAFITLGLNMPLELHHGPLGPLY